MAEILREWLSERLQRPIKWEISNFGDTMKDGQTIADVLKSYGAINENNHHLIKQTSSKEDIDSNWQLISEWLSELHIELDDPDLINLKNGKSSNMLRLFYQLFLALDKRDRIDYIQKEYKNASTLFSKQSNDFFVDREATNDPSKIDYLAKPLINEKYYIEWQRKKEAEVKEIQEFLRHKHMKKYYNEDVIKGNKNECLEKSKLTSFFLKDPCKYSNYSYSELVNLEEKTSKIKYNVIDSDWTKQFLKNLQCKTSNKLDSKKFQKQISNDLTNLIWKDTIAEEESNFDSELAQKVMKLSQIEKQMCTQIMETKQQARNLFKNRIEAEKILSEQREKQFAQYFNKLKDQINLEVGEIYFEKARQNKLHIRLFKEKLNRKKQHYLKICHETAYALVDIAIKYGFVKNVTGDEVPEHIIQQWKTLFINNQPIFEIIENVENVIEKCNEKRDPEIEVIKRCELDRQECLNNAEFISYNKYENFWSLEYLIPNYDNNINDRNCEFLGNKILAHVIYTLLPIKYPFPPKRLPAELPPFCSKVILRNLPERSTTISIQTLLNYRKLFVVRLESAINYCLNKYKLEMVGCIDIEMSYENFLSLAPEQCKELVKNMKNEDSTSDIMNMQLPFNVKQTQTPKSIPEENIILSPPAELGKYVYKALCSGDTLTDHLISAIIVEYLKNQCDIKGFVIINYPNSYREAQILEETLLGRAPPNEEHLNNIEEMYLEENIQKYCKKEKDPFESFRHSKLLDNPHNTEDEPPFISYFTAYINLKKSEDILREEFIWCLTEENSDLIDRFYATLGINYSLYYEYIDKDVLEQLCKYIIGDFELPLKSNNSLFGENVFSTLDFFSSDTKRQNTKMIKPDRTTIQKMNSTSSNLVNTSGVESLQSTAEIKSNVVLEETVIIDESIPVYEENILSLPGEKDWVYGDLPIPENIGISLTTVWETIEKSYINDLKQSFFAKRMQMNCLIPYARFLKDKMKQIISLPSPKQELVLIFLQQFNRFEDDWRNSNISKNEWHCRIKELQKKIYTICDERKIHAERQRQALITENWAIDEITCMVNTFISCMQTELNRSLVTYQLLHDFYFTLLKEFPTTDRIVGKDLFKISRDILETKKISSEEKIFRQLKTVYIEMQLKNVEIDFSNNPFNAIIENNVKNALKLVKDINDSYRVLISKENVEISKITAPIKTKRDPRSSSSESVTKEDTYKVNALKCLEEWIAAVNGEMCRFDLRIQAIQQKCYREIKMFSDHITKTFLDIQKDINVYYINELKSVDRLCKYLQMAVESNRKIPETLTLVNDTFEIDPNLLQFPKLKSQITSTTNEAVNDCELKIGQISRLRSQFQIVAPSGIIIQQALIYIIQDFILFSKESCQGNVFPKAWQNFDPDNVSKLISKIFGEILYVDWRDFLLYCLNIRYPSIDELLCLRKQLRCNDLLSSELINRESFFKQRFWFEDDFDCNDRFMKFRLMLTKHFLFEIYSISYEFMNYSAFLLGFSKNENPLLGFATALSITVGKKVCYDLHECESEVQKLIFAQKYNDACKACAINCAKEYVDIILNKTMNECLGTSVTEVEFTVVQDKKKKGKGSNKTKNNGAQSDRVLKESTNESKMKPNKSSLNITTTTIGTDIEPPAILDVVNKDESITSIIISPQPESVPDVLYSIQQEVIWKVLKICLPWPFDSNLEPNNTTFISEIKSVLLRLEKDTDDKSIYVSKFVNDPTICRLLHNFKKFYAVNLVNMLRYLK